MELSLNEAVRKYVEERTRTRSLSRKSARDVACRLGVFVVFMENRQQSMPALRSIVRDDVVAWIGTMEHAKAWTVHAKRSTLSKFFRWYCDRGELDIDPTLGVPSIRIPQSLARDLAEEDVAALYRACPDRRATLIVTLAVQEGLRREEVARLRREDIDWRGGALVVTGKNDKTRAVPLMDATALDLRAYLDEVPGRFGPVIRSKLDPSRGIGAPAIGQLMRGWMAAAGIKHFPWDGVSMHALRHTCATDTYENCGDLAVVQEMLGHTSLDTTRIYVRRIPSSRVREAMAGRDYRAS